MIAAHKTLKCGTQVWVLNKRSNKKVLVEIVDRGPYTKGRIIDLTPAAAKAIGMGWGLAQVEIFVTGEAPARIAAKNSTKSLKAASSKGN